MSALPIAPLLRISHIRGKRRGPMILGPFRLANASTIYVWRFQITWRRAWIEESKRALYPKDSDRG